MTNEDKPSHSINELWKAQNQTQKEVGEMRSEISAINTSIKSLTHGFDGLINEFRSVNKPKDVNWGWLISAILLLGVVIGLYVGPVQILASKNEARYYELLNALNDDYVETQRELATHQEWIRLQEGKIIRMQQANSSN
jgi:hypothetical protein